MIHLSVCRSVTIVSPARSAELIELSFGVWTWVCPRNHVLDGGPDPPWQRSNFEGEGRPIVNHRDSLPWAVQKLLNQSRWRLRCWVLWVHGTMC